MQIGPNRGIWDGRGAMASGWESEGLGFELQQLQATFESNKNILSLKDPLKIPNFSIFSLWFKRNLFGLGQKVFGSNVGQLLIYCGSEVCSGRVRAHLYYYCLSRRVGGILQHCVYSV